MARVSKWAKKLLKEICIIYVVCVYIFRKYGMCKVLLPAWIMFNQKMIIRLVHFVNMKKLILLNIVLLYFDAVSH